MLPAVAAVLARKTWPWDQLAEILISIGMSSILAFQQWLRYWPLTVMELEGYT